MNSTRKIGEPGLKAKLAVQPMGATGAAPTRRMFDSSTLVYREQHPHRREYVWLAATPTAIRASLPFWIQHGLQFGSPFGLVNRGLCLRPTRANARRGLEEIGLECNRKGGAMLTSLTAAKCQSAVS
jgi:hypothetical protein